MVASLGKITARSTLIFCLTFCATALAQVRGDPERWGALTLGLTSLDAQVGWYDLGGSPVDVRVVGSYALSGCVFCSAPTRF